MFIVTKSIDVDFAHHVSGHEGGCINIHGHTWKFEVGLQSDVLNGTGFVADFKQLKTRVLRPVHQLLDHSLALSEEIFEKIEPELMKIGQVLVSTRAPSMTDLGYDIYREGSLEGARNVICNGMKIATFPFAPTCERLASWLYDVARRHYPSDPKVHHARVYETLHPVRSFATCVR